MDLFGVGPLELLLILLIALVVLGPKEMASSARKLAGFIRKTTQSPTWRQMVNTSRELRDLPTRLVRESGLEEQVNEIRRDSAFTPQALPVKPVSPGGPAQLTPPPADPPVSQGGNPPMPGEDPQPPGS